MSYCIIFCGYLQIYWPKPRLVRVSINIVCKCLVHVKMWWIVVVLLCFVVKIVCDRENDDSEEDVYEKAVISATINVGKAGVKSLSDFWGKMDWDEMWIWIGRGASLCGYVSVVMIMSGCAGRCIFAAEDVVENV